MSIMVVDDDDDVRDVLEDMLEQEGIDVFAAKDGKAALDLLHRHAANIQLILTDIKMSDMDGFELMRQIKSFIRWESIPVVFLTAYADIDHVKQAVFLGCDSFIVKPIERSVLLNKVRQVLARQPV